MRAIVNIIIFLLTSISCYAQDLDKDTSILSRKQLQNLILSSGFEQYPIVRDTFDKYPKSLIIHGTIKEFTRGTSCGFLCGCGTLKVELNRILKHYPHQEIFIAIPCFNDANSKIIGKKILAEVKVLSVDNDDCFFKEVALNSIDSKGIPFYIPSISNIKFLIE